ncbi:hypothetical protein DYB28_003551 [Aphanomyces astaci]|uniref:Uncharacterized protein n=1 Tax=Aphanomyces astaci TaxID=112090 RepID=A0A397ENA4_APHAT|nr:hypothetical protein DYB25_005127 [Aphanomyces astaci]RHY75618.1 hypothetical protein DYB38_005530 [Aphanomyces astaci]RHY82133.1 hypothetical protein DYB26_004219 [Aphanomyces astaci]RHZ00955.1 hypothetical protein DYB31_003678 [Aphanomyces astaci]RLO09165.1 hypothetical protein DYB28_003551 [Aphanomyces astaci]
MEQTGKILVELPTELGEANSGDDRKGGGWSMAAHPRVTVKLRPPGSSKVGLIATWLQDQHALEVVVAEGAIPMHTSVQLTIAQVKNPATECPPTVARVTTLMNQGGGVIDGPAKVDVSRIIYTSPNGRDGMLPVSKVVLALALMSISQSEASLEGRIKVTSIEQPGDPVAPAPPKKGAVDVTPPPPKFKDFVHLDDYLNFFTTIYAPAFKFGEELRTVAGRGQGLDRMRELIQCGCDPNAKDGAGWAALHYAAEHGVLKAVNLLLEQPKLDLNARDVSGWTPLMCAASNGHVPVIARLLEMGADIAVQSAEGRTALHWAATRGMDAAVGFLVLGGANIEARDRSKWTPLHCAAIHGNVGCAKLLLDHGAAMAAEDALGHPAWEYWEAPAVTLLQAHLDKLEVLGMKKPP